MNPLPWPDHHHLEAAEAWLELGNPDEARRELALIDPAQQGSLEVLNVGWQLQSGAKAWTAALATAKKITRLAPDSPVGWIHLSYTLHELGRTQEAWDNLDSVAKKFPKDATIAYNRACYACCLGKISLARDLFLRVLKLGDRETVKRTALEDPDLKPLWEVIAGLGVME